MSTPKSFSRLVSASVVGSWSSFAMVYLCLSLCWPRCNVWHLSGFNFSCNFWDQSCSAVRSLCRRLESSSSWISVKILVTLILSVVSKHQYARVDKFRHLIHEYHKQQRPQHTALGNSTEHHCQCQCRYYI